MDKKLQIVGVLLGVLGIILGAFAAHGLNALIGSESVETFKTGVRYQIYHAFLLLTLGNMSAINQTTKKYILLLVLFGVLCFSGSIYGLATDDLTVFNFKSIALLTPFGGMLLIVGWGLMLIALLKTKSY